MTTFDSMTRYHLLGHTGLRISPLALGTMTFGQDQGGSDEQGARRIFRRYLEAGGNFVDTADIYAGGASERLVGRFIAEDGLRERVVLATKFSQLTQSGNPNAVGNGRKHLRAALEESLRRIGTDYIDLYWLHIWDGVTPVAELVSTMDALVRAGKIHAYGLSNVPAWYAVQAHVLARANGLEPPAALQMQYSLLEREIEPEHVPAAIELGMGITPWSPLANGFLTGKYTRNSDGATVGPDDGRLRFELYQRATELLGGRTERHWAILDAVTQVAAELDRTPAQVALNWVAHRPGVGSTIIGARRPDQLEANLGALEFSLPEKQLRRLDSVSAAPRTYQSVLADRDLVGNFLFGGLRIDREPAWYRASERYPSVLGR